jgi:hypothetical protein
MSPTTTGLSISTLLFFASLVLLPQPVRAELGTEFDVDLKAAIAGYRASKLLYKPVSNDRSEIVGTLEDVIIGADGKANFALIDVGSLSLGAHIVVVPFERLRISKDEGTMVLPGAARSELQKLAVFP